MSEFSESYHLQSERAEDAIELLRRALLGKKRNPAIGRPENVSLEPGAGIVDAAIQPLLHYVSAEDHGWSFTLFDRANVVCAYSCDWDDEITVDDSQYSRASLVRYIPAVKAALLDDLESRLNPEDIDELFEVEPSKLFAQAIGLEHYDWLSYDFMARDFDESPEDHTDVTEVS